MDQLPQQDVESATLCNPKARAQAAGQNNSIKRLSNFRELSFVLGLLLAIKFGTLWLSPKYFPLEWDAISYVKMARTGQFDSLHPLGYGWFLRLCFTLMGEEDPATIVGIQCGIGAVTAFVAFIIARNLLRLEFVFSLFIALLHCVSPLNFLVERTLLAESVTLFLLAAYLFCLVGLTIYPTMWRCALTGLLAGALPLFRTVYLFAAPLAILVVVLIMLHLHKSSVRRALYLASVCGISWMLVYYPYCFAYSAAMRGHPLAPPFVPTMISGRMIWARVLPLLEETDLKNFKWGDELYHHVALSKDSALTDLGWVSHMVPGPNNPTQRFLDRLPIPSNAAG